MNEACVLVVADVQKETCEMQQHLQHAATNCGTLQHTMEHTATH